MEITPIGWLLIPLGGMLFLASPTWLYLLAVFFAPFTATSILNRGSGDGASGIQPYMFFGALLMLRKILDLTSHMTIDIRSSIRRPLLLYLLFIVMCLISLIMPIAIDGKLEVLSNGTLNAALEPLRFGSKNITAIIALLFGFFFTVIIARHNAQPRQFHKTLQVYMISALFICFWGLMQFGFVLIHVPYPTLVFNNSASPYAQLGGVMSSLGIVRISSVAMEPSVLAVTLIGMLPLCIVALLRKTYILGRTLDRLTVLIITVTLILTGSATGYIALVAMMTGVFFYMFRYKLISLRRFYIYNFFLPRLCHDSYIPSPSSGIPSRHSFLEIRLLFRPRKVDDNNH